jgi:ribulose-phosphate 3-epimerase
MKVSTSILSCNPLSFGETLDKLSRSKTDYLHIDVMDGQFVPNISFGQDFISSIKKVSNKPLDVHLMVENMDFQKIDSFINAGSDILTIHAETSKHLHRNLEYIKSKGIKCGVALNPATHESSIENVLDIVDLILVMTVNPGFGGQKFIPSQLKKISNIKNMIGGRVIEISVDGGINPDAARLCKEVGASMCVSGSYITNHENINDAIQSLKDI